MTALPPAGSRPCQLTLEAGADEMLADELTQQVKRGLSAEPASYLQQRG